MHPKATSALHKIYLDKPQVQGWAYVKLDKREYYSLQEPTNTKLINISYGKINLELETIINIKMQIHVPQ